MELRIRNSAFFILLLAELGFLPVRLAAQTGTGAVAGRVTARSADGVEPAPGAAVALAEGGPVAKTDAAGLYLLNDVPAARGLVIRVRLLGYRTAERAIRVAAGDTVRVDFVLEPEAQLLAPVRAAARSADLERFESTPDVATLSIGAAAMSGVPSIGEPDVIRVAQLLPGVVARNDYSTGLNVRGGEADQNLILLDGHPIYNPFHLGGLFSTFMDATVGGIELMTGAFPARFGGRLSSVLDVQSAEEARPGVNAVADVSVLGATAKLGGAFGDGRGMWSVAARRTYADAVTAAFTENVFPYHFSDMHARIVRDARPDLRLAITAYVGRDALDLNLAEFESDSGASRAGEGQWDFDWGNRVLGVTLSKRLDRHTRLPLIGWRVGDRESATLEHRVSTSAFSTMLDVGDGASSLRNEISDVRVSGSLSARGSAHDRSFGYEVATHRLRYSSIAPRIGTTEFDIQQRPMSSALWVDDLWRVSPRWLLQGGLRAEGLTATGRRWTALSPRASLKYFATPRFALTAATGRATQWLHSLAGDGPLRYFDIWIASDSFIPVTSAWHWVAGAERRLGRGDAASVRVEGYFKRYDRALDANPSEDPQRRGDELFPAEGESYGVDLLARWAPRGTTGIAGWVAYSYALSSRWRDGLRWAPGHDRRHDVDVVATWRLTRYRLGARFGFATGTPYTHVVGQLARRVYDPSLDRWGTGDARIFLDPLGAPRNGARLPSAHRLDLDASREFRVGGATIAPYVSVVNAYNAKNVFVYLYNYSTSAPTRRALSQFPVLPSAGVRVVF